jgi:signal transduction histidine kinase/CheY-like chemotaxis protein
MTDLDGLIKETLVFIAQKGWAQAHREFFAALVSFLGEKLEIEYVLVSELLAGQRRARTVGLYAAGNLAPDLEYDLRGTPCENVMGNTLCCYPSHIQQLFPEDRLLQDMSAECYLGIPLWDSRGNPLGLIAVMGMRPLQNREAAEAVLQMVAVRCAHELERKRSDEDRRRLEAQMLRFEKLDCIGSLAGGVAHDMNNVLAAIMGVTSMLRERFQNDPSVAASLDLVLQASQRGRKLVTGLSDFARVQLEDAAPLDLNDLVRQEVELLGRTTFNRIQLETVLAEPLPLIFGEASALGNVLMNLSINAIDAMPEGGRLTFRTRRLADGGVELSLTDTGHGMTPEVRAKALDPYFTTKPPGKGTGLGLSIVFGTMKAHRGSVDIESEPGAGTTIHLQFPPFEAAGHEPSAELAVPQVQTSRALRILLVDDEEMIRESTTSLLQHMGHCVEAADNGREGLDRLLGEQPFDLVVLDQNMPGMTGLETLKELRELHSKLPVIFSSGLVTDSLSDVLAAHSHVWLLTKPFVYAELRHVVGQACP